MPEIIAVATAQATTNAYVPGGFMRFKVPTNMTHVVFWIKELDVHTITFKVMGSMDGVDYTSEVIAATDVAKGTQTFTADIVSPWRYLDCQVQAKVGGAQGSVTAYAVGN